jgi:hypothetical protein
MASVNALVDILRSPLQAKVEDGEFHCRALRRRSTHCMLAASAASRFKAAGIWKLAIPYCWVGWLIIKNGEKTFKV